MAASAAAADVYAAASSAAASSDGSGPAHTAGPHLDHNSNYRTYSVALAAGGTVPGSIYEARVMCKNVYDAADYNMWALQHFIVLASTPEFTTFQGQLASGDPVVVGVIIDQNTHVPEFLSLDNQVVASCSGE